MLELCSKLMYSRQGFDTNITGGIITLNYLNIPFMAKYYVSKRFNLEAGSQIGFSLSTKERSRRL